MNKRALIITERDLYGFPIAYSVIDTEYDHCVIRTVNESTAAHYAALCESAAEDKPYHIAILPLTVKDII